MREYKPEMPAKPAAYRRDHHVARYRPRRKSRGRPASNAEEMRKHLGQYALAAKQQKRRNARCFQIRRGVENEASLVVHGAAGGAIW